ncbi:hypothetical protein [Roseospira visakhapatnamensis]|uniref:Uncharacterized protein n=1 Tax=Roseospira visakhapatnamensis TaxID=390880 RepID=A0A7W6RD82_9PROT|nr:hypothetical protein [Roseospira visakhapatnamensis]MBB4266302.1 hypothetical protein [Roseospira visakhapatnamensis]
MSATLNAAAIATLALRRIGQLAPIDSAAAAAEHGIALQYLDLQLAELALTERLWPLLPAAVDVALEAGRRDYALTERIAPPFAIVLRLTVSARDGAATPVALVRRKTWDGIADKDGAGRPTLAHLLHDRRQTLRLHPVPGEAMTLHVTGQVASPDVTAERGGGIAHGLPDGWQRYLVLAVAADIGAGPVLTLPVGEIDRIRAEATALKSRLLTRGLQETLDRPRTVRPWR